MMDFRIQALEVVAKHLDEYPVGAQQSVTKIHYSIGVHCHEYSQEAQVFRLTSVTSDSYHVKHSSEHSSEKNPVQKNLTGQIVPWSVAVVGLSMSVALPG